MSFGLQQLIRHWGGWEREKSHSMGIIWEHREKRFKRRMNGCHPLQPNPSSPLLIIQWAITELLSHPGPYQSAGGVSPGGRGSTHGLATSQNPSPALLKASPWQRQGFSFNADNVSNLSTLGCNGEGVSGTHGGEFIFNIVSSAPCCAPRLQSSQLSFRFISQVVSVCD